MKAVFNIPAGASFLDTLARHVWDQAGGDGLALSRYLILLPTRRSCRQLGAAFARVAGGRATLLPRLQPLGDADEEDLAFADPAGADALDMPPAIAPLRRLMLLTRAVQTRDPALSSDQAALAATALARFLDEIEREQCDPSRLPYLVDQRELAEHWQQTVSFLDIILHHWPRILADQGCLDPAERRNRVLAAQAALWRRQPPDHPVIAAGAVGSIPASAALLEVIAELPQGAVVLPGLDRDLDDAAWDGVEDSHPQAALKHLLDRMHVARSAVVDISSGPAPAAAPPRLRLLSEAARPAASTDAWQHLRGQLDAAATAGLSALTLDQPQEEAQVIALQLRGWLETAAADQTAALVTPDRALAARVAALLQRWEIAVDDSAGQPLDALPPGVFLNLVLAAAAAQAGAVDRLALLKHPLAACGMTTAGCRVAARNVEYLLRQDKAADFDWLDRLLTPLRDGWTVSLPLTERIARHIAAATAVAASDLEAGATRLWHGEAGEALSAFLSEWQDAAGDMPALTGGDYAALFAQLANGQTARSVRASHPQIAILGLIEARLLAFDLVILGGLNEGQWPPDAGYDPWLSRPMRADLGLPAPERRIGTAAHDFDQLAAAPKVLLTRAGRVGGAPTVASRFLLQLDAVLRAAGLAEDGRDPLTPDAPLRHWARMLDLPEAQQPCSRPRPCPPLAARPVALPVTDIALWRRNPYGLYAKRILRLRALNDLDTPLDASDKGNFIHTALETFVTRFPDSLPDDAEAQLLTIGGALAAHDDPRVRTFWWRQFTAVAAWFVATERERRAARVRPVKAEANGQMMIGDFKLYGRADRIDRSADGALIVVDYKTGTVPGLKTIKAGYEPQLALLALIAGAGGFTGVVPDIVEGLEYWQIRGGAGGSRIAPVAGDLAALTAHAAQGLRDLIATFALADTVYHAAPIARLQGRYDDYAHLARLAEWGRGGEDT